MANVSVRSVPTKTVSACRKALVDSASYGASIGASNGTPMHLHTAFSVCSGESMHVATRAREKRRCVGKEALVDEQCERMASVNACGNAACEKLLMDGQCGCGGGGRSICMRRCMKQARAWDILMHGASTRVGCMGPTWRFDKILVVDADNVIGSGLTRQHLEDISIAL